jgi:hypothetical protein
LSLWYLSKINLDLLKLNSSLKSHYLEEIVTYIEKKDWNKAKEIWLTKIMSLNIADNINLISTEGTEHEFFIKYLEETQKHQVIQK